MDLAAFVAFFLVEGLVFFLDTSLEAFFLEAPVAAVLALALSPVPSFLFLVCFCFEAPGLLLFCTFFDLVDLS